MEVGGKGEVGEVVRQIYCGWLGSMEETEMKTIRCCVLVGG